MAYKILALVILCALCVAPVPEKIAFIGDSYTRGMLDGPTDAWYGFAGRVADARNARHYRWCPATFSRAFEIWQRVVGYQPDIIVIELGIHWINGREPETIIEDAIPQIMRQALAVTPRVIFVAIPWRAWDFARRAEAVRINKIIYAEAARLGVSVADSYSELSVCGLDCISADDRHPNAKGHQIIADSVLEMLVRRVFIPVKF